jgi:hypothetical protein
MAMYWVFYMLIQQVLSIQALVLGFEMERSTLLIVICDFMWRKKWTLLAFEKQRGFTNQFLLGFYIKNMFKQRIRFFMVHFDTFVKKWVHICENNIHLGEIQFQWKIRLQCP